MADQRADPTDELPTYARMMAAYHEAFEPELRRVVRGVPLAPGSRVVDLACGDGSYTRWLAERVGDDGEVLGVDLSAAFLHWAEAALRSASLLDRVRFVRLDVEHSPLIEGRADLVWCAQSLYSLPDPAGAVRRMAALARPGGRVVVFESDELHHVTLSWPVEIELALRAAELRAFQERSDHPARFYIARDLPRVFREAGLPGCEFRSFAFNRQAPFDRPTRRFLDEYLTDLRDRVSPFLDPARREEFAELVAPESPRRLVDDPDALVVCVDHLAVATREAG
ncbi:methyltransferase domain-containing protein [Planctomyces sp. SH-PL62]|uniref:methyltransferase domain-containing protein n=1 Tax=Planctomyces sp. SH-PL62 TaxID=1636152 RepID=UPI00078D3513|nr:methyltransferase domain-containing protein [Planctomyces sp. SH-PL62]AMV39520.1 Demethylmenaquinone methyltransferase [Planctomyces sp. SH-PL62]